MQIDNVDSNNSPSPNSPVRVLAFLEAKEGKRQELMNILVPLIESSRKEEGNIAYVLHSSVENPNELLFDEVWSSKDTFDEHYQKPDSYEARSKVANLLARPMEIKLYKEANQFTE